MDITQINDSINHDILLSKRRAKREMTKKGFVTVDGNLMQYNPMMTKFIPVNNEDLIQYFNWIIGTSWQTLSPGNIIVYLKEQLPNFTEKDINNFTAYVEQSQLVIDEDLIQELMKKAIADNEVYKNTKADFKGKLNLQTELIVLRNNDIYSDGDWKLFKLEDGDFTRIKANGLLTLFRQTIGTENTKLVLQYVKNHWQSYVDSLTNVNKLTKLLMQKNRKENTLTECKPGYDEVMKIISNYGGK